MAKYGVPIILTARRTYFLIIPLGLPLAAIFLSQLLKNKNHQTAIKSSNTL